MNHRFYFLLALTAALAATVNALKPVLDTDGDIIFDGSYYVLPRISGPGGGGLSLTSRGGNWCPLYIGQEYSEVNRGIPIKFSNWMIQVAFAPESTSLNIQMDVPTTICGQSTYWYVPPPKAGVIDPLFIAAGPKRSSGLFHIKKINDALGGYKIVFCPNDSDCSDIGIFVDRH
ncbi:kunitz trypsin inhibitor 4-like [Brassica napus]|nr:kunitz trypsin inhibitor 4-like [Brassica napus]